MHLYQSKDSITGGNLFKGFESETIGHLEGWPLKAALRPRSCAHRWRAALLDCTSQLPRRCQPRACSPRHSSVYLPTEFLLDLLPSSPLLVCSLPPFSLQIDFLSFPLHSSTSPSLSCHLDRAVGSPTTLFGWPVPICFIILG